MNSFHLAILQASSNDRFPQLGDAWRNYHPHSVLSDSDYPSMTDQYEVNLSDPLPPDLTSQSF